MKKYLLPILTTALCLNATSAFAQKKDLVKGLIDGLSSKTPATLSSQVERKVASRLAAQTAGQYHPTFGYVHSPALKELNTVFHNAIVSPASLMQIAPILDETNVRKSFTEYHFLDTAETAEMIYLWRLANSDEDLRESRALLFKLAQEKAYMQGKSPFINKQNDLPNMLFLKMLMDPNFTPHSYAQLLDNITGNYPKHITLNECDFPVKTADADYADILDNYLMLSNPKEMTIYNNAGKYTPFVLTKEEHAAADKLLALRRAGEKLPWNPTPSDLLELAYNRLEAHLVPYSSVKYDTLLHRWNVSADYKAYPNYKNTHLYRSIKGMIRDQEPIKSYDGYYYTLENMDMTHLIVLDAVMGGVEPDNLAEVSRVLYAFEELCAEVHPKDMQDIDHLVILQTNLRVVFKDLISFADEQIDLMDPQWEKWRIANKAWSLLEANPIFNLVGRNWNSNYY